MRIGVPREIKVHEYRVGLTPDSVRELCARGHRVLVEAGAGAGIGASDAEYAAAGAEIAADAAAVYAGAELLVKVKEPLAAERARLRAEQALFTYLHLAPDPRQAEELLASGVSAIGYETVTAPGGGLPLLAPMSEVAGRMSIQVAAHFLERPQGGRGLLLTGASGVAPGHVVVLGAGVVGSNAARLAAALGAQVTVLSRSAGPLQSLAECATTALASSAAIAAAVREADAVIGAALVAGAAAPQLVTRAMLASMKRGAVLVDVSIDQGGCFETSRPTTHAEPVFETGGILHYAVPNMPGAVPRTSTYALNRATLPLVIELAERGIAGALAGNAHLRDGLQVHRGAVVHRAVAAALNLPFREPRFSP
jgi:alanine dehydrogenase